MPKPPAVHQSTFSRRLAPTLLPTLLAWLLPLTTVCAQSSAHKDKGQSEQAQTKQQLAELHSKMAELAKQQAQTADQRDSATEQLAKQALAVSAAARALHDVDQQLAAKQAALETLERQRDDLKAGLRTQHEAIAELLRAAYTLGHGSDLRLLLGDEDVARVSRALAYSKYFQDDRLSRVKQLMIDLSKLQDTEAAITAEQQALQAARAKRASQAQALQQQRSAQQKLLAQVDAQYKDQGQRLAALKQDEQALNQVLDKIQKAIEQAAREAAAAARAQHTEPSHETGSNGANIRGNLPWPAPGNVRSYGNGVLINAPQGSEVHAVARGKVVFANFLRGYGMLLILNHGDGWMSMYGNNETLLHKVGDQIDAGQAVGTASGAAGDNSGVYFELRDNGKPVEPSSWLSRRH